MTSHDLTVIEIKTFWHILPHEQVLFQKKRGVSKLVYLLFFRWFEKYAMFPKNNKSMPLDLIDYGILLFDESIKRDDFFAFLKQDRTINRYKQEIREHFGFRGFDENCPEYQKFLFEHVFKEKNDAILQVLFCTHLKKSKIEIPYEFNLTPIIQRAKEQKERYVFLNISEALSPENKQYIDENLLSNNDLENTFQFLRQDAGAPTKDSAVQEIKHLQILGKFPIQFLKHIDDIHSKQRNLYRRRLFTDTPRRTKRRSDIDRYALATIFCYQRYQEAIDNLADYLIYFIHRIKKIAETKQKKLDKEIGKRLGDIDQLYELAEINRDYPKEIIEEVVYPAVSQEAIDPIIKTRDFARQSKKEYEKLQSNIMQIVTEKLFLIFWTI